MSRRAVWGGCIILAIACGDHAPSPSAATQAAPSTPDAQAISASDAPDSVVYAEMRHVNMHVESGIVLHIHRLRGRVLSTRHGAPPALNDKTSMLIVIESGDISIDTASLSTLLNRHVFGYRKSPLRNLHARVDGDQLELSGDLHKLVWLPFRIRATASLTPDGMIRVHPTSIRVLGLGITGLSERLGGMNDLLKLESGHGARTDGDDLVLDPSRMLPPPTIRGRLSSIAVEPGGLRQRFGSSDSTSTTPRGRTGSSATNYMYFHGGTLRFGKLTMRDTDLEIVDANPSDPFDYSLDRYLEHLVAGQSNTTKLDGLIVVMPDVGRLKRADKP